MSERFLIQATNADGLPVTNPQETRSEDGYLKDLTIEGILEILTGGMIKNTAQSYLIDDTGLTLFGSSDNEAKMTGDTFQVGTIVGGSTASLSPFKLTIALNAFPGNKIEITSDEIKFFNAGGIRGTIAGYVGFSDTTNATSKDTGAITTEGGIGVEKDVFAGGKIITADTTDATSTTTGAMRTAGGFGVAKNLHVGGILVAPTVSVAGITDADSPYSVPVGASYIATDSSTGGITVNLPTGTDGRKITIFDTNGSAITNAVTINRAGSDTINGSTNVQLTNPYESVTLVFYSGNWTII